MERDLFCLNFMLFTPCYPPPMLLFSSCYCLWLYACRSQVDFPSSVGRRNVSEEFQKLSSGQTVEYVLEEQRRARCRVALRFSALVLWCVGICSTYSVAPNLTCRNDSHVHEWKEVSQA